MAIAVGQPVDEITHRLGGIEIDGHGRVDTEASSVVPSMDVISVQPLPQEELEHPGGEGVFVLPCAEPSFAFPAIHHTSVDFPQHSFVREDVPQHSFATPNSLIPLEGPTYPGYPASAVNSHGYMPYSADGVIYHNPVVEYNPVYNQNFYYSTSAPVTPFNLGYAQTFPYPQYQVAPVGPQYTMPAPALHEGGSITPEVQDPGSFITYGYPYASPQAVPVPTVGPPTACNSMPVLNPIPVSASNTPTGMLNPSAPMWIQRPVIPQDVLQDTRSHLTYQPKILTNLTHAGNQNFYRSRSDVKVNSADYKKYVRKELCPPHTAAVPGKNVWGRGHWQNVNAAQLPKVPAGKNKGPGSDPLDSECILRLEYNLASFSTDFDDAKHFIIKSFSDENVFKSIQHGVWASTSNGNKKLDEAFQDAQRRAAEKPSRCPVFLYFSVNGSGRFCGVAEMVGPVDYNSTMDFWERNRWCGSFPVTWHFIKDVPNCQLRKIILQNNENKPVTSSRDTQEVNFEQGMQMLNIVKNYSTKASILDNYPSFSVMQKEASDDKSEQSSPLQCSEQPVKETRLVGVLEKSNPLRACNYEAKARENNSQQGKQKDEDLTDDNGIRKPDKENVMIPDVGVRVGV